MSTMSIPSRITEMLDLKIILSIVVATVCFHVLGVLYFEQDAINAVDIMLFAGTISCMIFCGTYLKKYGISRHFERSVLLLGLAFACVLVGDLIYLQHDISGQENPFLSYADIFYSLFIPLIGASVIFSMLQLCHEILNKRFLSFVGISCIIGVGLFLGLNSDSRTITDFDAFVFGLASVAGTSSVAGMILYHLTLLQVSVFGVMRMVMLGGMLLSVTADIWYYSLESLELYVPMHPVDTMWFAAWLIIAYSVYLQIKKL